MEVATQLQNGEGCILKPHSVPHLTEMEALFPPQLKFYHVLLKKSIVEVLVPMHDLKLSHLQVYALHAQHSTTNETWIWVLRTS